VGVPRVPCGWDALCVLGVLRVLRELGVRRRPALLRPPVPRTAAAPARDHRGVCRPPRGQPRGPCRGACRP